MRMGMTYTEAKVLYFGTFCDLFDAYKEIHNFEKRGIYEIPDRLDRTVSMKDL